MAGHGAPVTVRSVAVSAAGAGSGAGVGTGSTAWLRDANAFIQSAFASNGATQNTNANVNPSVLVYCKTESRACAAVCAWLVGSGGEGEGMDMGMSVKEAVRVLEECE
jgi:hypothetical protein